MTVFNFRFALLLILLFSGISALWLIHKPPITTRAAEIFGARITIIIYDFPAERANAAINNVLEHFEDMHRRFHPWQKGETATINRAIANKQLPITVSAPMAIMLSLSIDYARRSNGLFNPAAGKLFGLWGFHSDTLPKTPPSQSAIHAAIAVLPDMQKIILSERILKYTPPATQFDFGAIAKGAALDDAKSILRQRGIKNALINIGGNILAMGNNGKRPWQILLYPKTLTIALNDGEAVATSGDTVRAFIYQGKRYHHIIDPRTGYPAAISTASAISDDSKHAGAISDAAATALVIANEDEARQIARNFNLVDFW